MKLIYAYATYAILGLIYSLVNIPYGSLASAVTQSVHERAKLVAARAFGAGIGGVMLTFIVGRLHQRPARPEGADHDPGGPGRPTRPRCRASSPRSPWRSSWSAPLAFWFTAWACREQVIRTQPRITIKETFGTLRSNKPLAYLCGSSFFYLIGLFAVGGTTAFYAQYVLGNIGLVGIITLVNTGIALLITPFIPKIIDMFGKKNVFQYCGVFTIVGGVGLFFAPANMFWLVLLTLAIKGIGASLINTVMFGLEADTVEYGEWKTGKRSEGATYALFSFTRKVTQSIGGAVGAWALAIGGYIAASAANPSPVQPDSAIIAIKATIGLLPAAGRADRHAHLHQVPAERREVQADPQRDRSPQAGRHRGAPREARGLHHPRPRGLTSRTASARFLTLRDRANAHGHRPLKTNLEARA